MIVFSDWNEEEFARNVRLLSADEKARVQDDLRGVLGVPSSYDPDALALLTMSKAKHVAHVGGVKGDLAWTLAQAAPVPPTEELYVFEAQMSGLPGTFAGDACLWLSNLLDWWTPGGEDVVCLGTDLRFVMVVEHDHGLALGDLREGSPDPELAARIAERLKEAKERRERVIARMALREQGGSSNSVEGPEPN